MLLKYLFLSVNIFLISISLIASSNEHHEISVTDLIWPTINFVILFGTLAYFLKGRLSSLFTNNAEKIETIYNEAKEKYEKSDRSFNDIKKKIDNIDESINVIHKKNGEALAHFKIFKRDETDEKVIRFKSDVENNLLHEKNMMLKEINKRLVEDIISSTKTKVKESEDIQGKVTQELILNI